MSEEPTKAKDSTARERFASTTFRTLPHAQTPEGMLEAKDAEIAALRAECAMKDAAISDLLGAQDYLDFNYGHPNKEEEPEWGVDPAEFQSKWQASIDEARAALTLSDVCKRYALMGRICCLAAEVESYEMAANPPFRFTEARIELSKALAALRELETK